MKNFTLFLFIILSVSNAFANDLNYKVTAKKLDESRNKLSPKTGSSSFLFTKDQIENLPQGQASSINQVLVRAPGVTQDSYGQLHVRNDHSNLQYRINDVIIPEGITGFGQVLDARFADSIDLLTGALPAQYGYRTAGVVDIKTKDRVNNSSLSNGAYSELMFGSNQTFGANQQVSGFKNNLNYFLTASYLQNDRGLEPPTSAKKSIHNETKQDKVFGYFSYLIDSQTRLNLILSNSTNRFQIPNNPNQETEHNLTQVKHIQSSELNDDQKESNRFAIASLQGVSDSEIDYQLSFFTRHSELEYRPDYVGNLIFNGASSDIDRSSFVNGLQGDFSKEINKQNTIRFGFYASDTQVKNDQSVYTIDSHTSDIYNIQNANSKHVKLYSLYLQDEYKPIEKLSLNLGARFDSVVGYVDEHQLSPRAGAVYDLNKETKLHAGFSRYFTAPKSELISNVNLERFRDTSSEPENFRNDRIRSERTNYYDAGISHKLTKEVNLSLNGYFKDIKNMLDEGQFGTALIYKPFNYQEAKVYGVEFSSDYKKDNFSAFTNIAWQKARARNIISSQYLIENEELDFISKNYVNPDHSQKISASAGASYLIDKTRLGGDVIFGSGLRKDFANTQKLASYTQFNIFANQEINKFNFRLAVNNLLDKKYKLRDGSGIGVGAPQFGMRRGIFFIVSKTF